MTTVVIGCGPYFSQELILMSVGVLLVGKFIMYWAFVEAFRYRVARAVPMSAGRAAGIAALRSVTGAGLLAIIAFWVLPGLGEQPGGWTAGVFLVAERIGMWFVLGWALAGVRGRRLAGWVFSGTTIDCLFDFAVYSLLASSPTVMLAIGIGLFFFLVTMMATGRRDGLLKRFALRPNCHKCDYDLRGNLSGVCPECGTPVQESVKRLVGV